MDYWSPKHVELLNVMNKINHQILCILLDYRYFTLKEFRNSGKCRNGTENNAVSIPKMFIRHGYWLLAGRSRNRIPVGSKFSAPVQIDPGAHPASYTMGTGSRPGLEQPETGDNPQNLSIANLKERVKLHFYVPSGTA